MTKKTCCSHSTNENVFFKSRFYDSFIMKGIERRPKLHYFAELKVFQKHSFDDSPCNQFLKHFCNIITKLLKKFLWTKGSSPQSCGCTISINPKSLQQHLDEIQQIENLAAGKSFVSPFFLFFSFLYTAVTLYVYLLRLLSRKGPTFASSNDDGAGSLHVEPVFETFMTKNEP